MHACVARAKRLKHGGVISHLPTTFQSLINISFPEMVVIADYKLFSGGVTPPPLAFKGINSKE
jgi:hypothetical protein